MTDDTSAVSQEIAAPVAEVRQPTGAKYRRRTSTMSRRMRLARWRRHSSLPRFQIS
jgi:hypothetical protein